MNAVISFTDAKASCFGGVFGCGVFGCSVFFFCLVAGVLFVLFGLVWFLCCASASLHAFVPSLTSA